MINKLFGAGDLLVLRNKMVRGIWITPKEFRDVNNRVGEIGYALYSFLRTYPFKEAEEITDKEIAKQLDWSVSKVKRARLQLEKQELFLTVRYGTKTDGITKMLVGLEPVALFNAGLPSDIINSKAHEKLKKELGIDTTEDLLKNVELMVTKYNENPKAYD